MIQGASRARRSWLKMPLGWEWKTTKINCRNASITKLVGSTVAWKWAHMIFHHSITNSKLVVLGNRDSQQCQLTSQQEKTQNLRRHMLCFSLLFSAINNCNPLLLVSPPNLSLHPPQASPQQAKWRLGCPMPLHGSPLYPLSC